MTLLALGSYIQVSFTRQIGNEPDDLLGIK